jgi:hypothetical protein
MAVAIPLIVAVASVGATVYSAVSSSQAQADAERTVKHQEMRAADQARKISAQNASDQEKRHRAILGTQEARYGASGLSMEGSPLLVQMESLKESEEQLRRIKEGGEIGYQTASELAQAAGKRAQDAQTSGYVNAIGSAATGTYKIGRSHDWW